VDKYENFHGRVNYAIRCFFRGRSATQTRSFDDCFEMHDGDLVVTAIVRRARRDSDLYQAIGRAWVSYDDEDPQFPADWLTTAAKFSHVRNLAGAARQMRSARRQEFQEWFAKQQEQQALTH
jgi:hypothetical protein